MQEERIMATEKQASGENPDKIDKTELWSENCIVIYSGEVKDFRDRLTAFAAEKSLKLREIEFSQLTSLQSNDSFFDSKPHLIGLVNDNEIHQLMKLCREKDLSLGLLPTDKASRVAGWLQIPDNFDKRIELAFQENRSKLDLITCNDTAFLGSASIGQMPLMRSSSSASQQTGFGDLFASIKEFFINLLNFLHNHPFGLSVRTGPESVIKTAATGLVLIENDRSGLSSRLVDATISSRDGLLSLLVISPRSIMDYLSLIFFTAFVSDSQGKKLPSAVSYIKTDYLELEFNHEVECFIDGKAVSGKKLVFTIEPALIKVNLSPEFLDASKCSGDNKKVMKIDNLPQNEQLVAIIQKSLPLFTCASEESFKDLFLILRNNARIRQDYLVMMFISSLVAGFGLFLNSAAVIIGAMLLAPLMGPIISLSMGLLRRDIKLLGTSLKTIFAGVTAAMGTSALMAFIIPLGKMTDEIAGRIQPSLLDLGVAIAAGAAGAYAHAREGVSGSLPGVAIAVALVPPLCVAGIGVGWLNVDVISGALLLFTTNLVGIALASALTFMMLGFAPVVKARLGLGISLLMLLAIGSPLSISFSNFHETWLIEKAVTEEKQKINGKQVELSEVRVIHLGDQIILRGFVTTDEELTRDDLKALNRALSNKLKRPLLLELSIRRACRPD